MKYTVITKSGRVMQFYVQHVAELYESIYGGVLIKDTLFAPGSVCQPNLINERSI